MTTARSLTDIFNNWFGSRSDDDLLKIKDKYGFILKVVVSKNIPPRHSLFSWIRSMGVTKFDELFGEGLTRMTDTFMLGFPERHCSLEEQGKLISFFVEQNKKFKWELDELCILTQSAYIISDCLQECVTIISLPEDKLLNQDFMI